MFNIFCDQWKEKIGTCKCILFDFHSLAKRDEYFYVELSNHTLRDTNTSTLLDISNGSENPLLDFTEENLSEISLRFSCNFFTLLVALGIYIV